jgi:pyruvate kinase
MTLPLNKTKIVCTIAPASQSRDVMEKLLPAGKNVARLNFSDRDFSGHKEVIENLRAAARATGRRLAIMADLTGPKMRIGEFDSEPIDLKPGDLFSLTTDDIKGSGSVFSDSLHPKTHLSRGGGLYARPKSAMTPIPFGRG